MENLNLNQLDEINGGELIDTLQGTGGLICDLGAAFLSGGRGYFLGALTNSLEAAMVTFNNPVA